MGGYLRLPLLLPNVKVPVGVKPIPKIRVPDGFLLHVQYVGLNIRSEGVTSIAEDLVVIIDCFVSSDICRRTRLRCLSSVQTKMLNDFQ